MNILEYIDFNILVLTICIGILYIYITSKHPEYIIKYPTPFNIGKIKYVDINNNCYKYTIAETKCPNNKAHIKTYNVINN